MPRVDDCIEFRFFLMSEDGEFGEDAVERVMDSFMEAVDGEGWTAGGCVGPPPPDEDECSKCEGSGVAEQIPEENKCPTCDGSGEVDPDSMSREEWEELYGTELP